uniref:uncharacterized protein LOC122775897 n=1 Tax=Solea senegalensis TaxID=28829 RepID=UPI001CD890E8|nr:uncharacterized protein LOC122775897 [Solea senegalensis]
MPELLEDMRKAPARDPRTRYRFFGYLAAYLSAIYGHIWSGVLTKMKVKEVKDAVGDEKAGYLVNVMEHKTLRKFGVAQIYLTQEEYGWCTEWLRLRQRAVPTNQYFFSTLGRGEAKDLIKYFRKAWSEMGLRGSPTLMDIRSAVATYNFESNDSEVRQHVATFMCHDVRTQERFYSLHNTLSHAKQMRELFVCMSLRRGQPAHSSASTVSSIAPSTAASSTSVPSTSTPSTAEEEMDPKVTPRIYGPSPSQLLVKKIKVRLGFSPRKKYPSRARGT